MSGLVFRVQIGAYGKTNIPGSLDQQNDNMDLETEGGLQKILIGLYRNYQDAEALRAHMQKIGVKDNDWLEVFNSNGAIVARAVVSQRVNEGMMLMYHAQEKLVHTPGSKITNARGGIHNSVTRATVKPTHMIGGYAQLSYGFNYYGTVGSNRDEFVIVRKMDKVDWMDEPAQVEAAE